MSYKTKPIDKIVTPFKKIFEHEKAGGIVLFLSVIIALILANSPIKEQYHHFFENTFLGFHVNGASYLEYSLHDWINDGLMAIFFFGIGLELKKEIVSGELSKPKKAILPIAAAIGGMLVPAAIYLSLNNTLGTHAGWGIPMATDIAFALGALMFLGKRIPISLKVFLLALAIVDDMGAVLVIAFFYSSDISIFNLLIGFSFFAVMMLGNKLGVRNVMFYAVLGIAGLWTAFLLSGVHATIAAVLAAFAIPTDVELKEHDYIAKIQQKLKEFQAIDPEDAIPTLKDDQLAILEEIDKTTYMAMTPLQKLINILHPINTFIIIPIFAIANAGVTLNFEFDTLFSNHIALGVGLGLLIGKVVGVVGATMLLVKLGIGTLPDGMTFKNLIGVGLLASIGFTMSIFVTNLAFTNELYITQAKLGIFVASLTGGLIGYFYLSIISKNSKP